MLKLGRVLHGLLMGLTCTWHGLTCPYSGIRYSTTAPACAYVPVQPAATGDTEILPHVTAHVYLLLAHSENDRTPLHAPVNVSQDTAMWDNDKTPTHVFVSAYQETAQLDNIKIHGHVLVSAHERTALPKSIKIVAPVIVTTYQEFASMDNSRIPARDCECIPWTCPAGQWQNPITCACECIP